MNPASRLAVIVTGMHRSGTSALTRVLNLLGVALPERLVPGSDWNKPGHWEPEEVVQIHDAMLEAAGSDVNDPVGFDPAWLDGPGARESRRRIAEFLERTFADRPMVAIKDPRVCLFLPAWREALADLGIGAVYLHPYRAPAEVAASLTRRQTRVYPDSVWPPERGGLLWLRYVTEAERETRGQRRAFLSYEGLLADWRGETARVAAQTGLSWPDTSESTARAVDAFLDRAHRNEAQVGGGPLQALDGHLADLRRLEADPHWDGHRFGDAAVAAPILRRYLNVHVMALERRNIALSARAAAPAVAEPERFEFEGLIAARAADGPSASVPDQALARALREAGSALRAERRRVQEAQASAIAQVEAAGAQARTASEADGRAALREQEAERRHVLAELEALRGAHAAERARRRALQDTLEGLRASPRAALALAANTLRHGPRDGEGRPWPRLHRSRVQAVRESGLFDPHWYRARYADVDASDMAPLDHFVAFGSRENRDPGPNFSAERYRAAHGDVAWGEEEPLFHYLGRGRAEGRAIFPAGER